MIDFSFVTDHLKTIGSCVTAIGAVAGGYVYLDGPIPATRQYVITETKTIKQELVDTRLQLNTTQRNLFRKEQVDRQIDIQKTEDANVKRLLQERLDTVKDELDRLESERDDLKKK
jgi:hypothetical protein